MHKLLILLCATLLTACTPQQTPSLNATEARPPAPVVSSASMDFTIEEVATGLFVPWDMVFTPPNRMLVTERNGKIREIVDGKLRDRPLIEFDDVRHQGEAGLLGMALHPSYSANKWIYVSIVVAGKDGPELRVERLKDEGTRLVRDKVIKDGIPTGQFHAGSRLVFDTQGLLYVTTGDGTTRQRSQDPSSLAGKILRMTDEGAIPAGQQGYAVVSGIRNSQGFTFLDDTTFLLTDHGPSGFDGPTGGDELNIGKIGDNFGWPTISYDQKKEGMISPAAVFTPSTAPASAMFYTGDAFPAWKGHAFIGFLRGEGLLRAEVVKEGNTWRLVKHEKVPGIDPGRIRAVVQGPDGLIYFSTSNRDGRGTVRAGDDKILRLRPR